MNRSLLVAGIGAVVICMRVGISAKAPKTEIADMWLEGTIGDAPVRMYIGPGGWPLGNDRVWGAYFYTRHWEFIPLEGRQPASNVLELAEGDPSRPDAAHPRFRVTIGTPNVSGTWMSADGSRTLPVKLRTIKQPPTFKQAIAHPRTFADPAWPITFTYPDGWSLKNSGTTLLLQSPDPFDMLFDRQLECERGDGVPIPPAAGEAPKEFQDNFYRTHDGWVVATGGFQTCDDPGDRCEAPRTRSSGGGLLMDADVAYRMHGPWGYAGIGEAVVYLAIDGNRWARCSDRVFDSPDRIRLVPQGKE